MKNLCHLRKNKKLSNKDLPESQWLQGLHRNLDLRLNNRKARKLILKLLGERDPTQQLSNLLLL